MLTPVFFSVDLLPPDEGGGGTEDSALLRLRNTGLLYVKAPFSCRFEKKHKLSHHISYKHVITNKCRATHSF